MLIVCQIEGQILDIPAGPQPPNPAAKCPIYRWNLQHKYNYTVNASTDMRSNDQNDLTYYGKSISSFKVFEVFFLVFFV